MGTPAVLEEALRDVLSVVRDDERLVSGDDYRIIVDYIAVDTYTRLLVKLSDELINQSLSVLDVKLLMIAEVERWRSENHTGSLTSENPVDGFRPGDLATPDDLLDEDQFDTAEIERLQWSEAAKSNTDVLEDYRNDTVEVNGMVFWYLT